MERLTTLRGKPESITTDNGGEFAGRAMEVWAHQSSVKMNFIRPGRPVENGFIESFNGRLRDECLNGQVFFDLTDAQRKLEEWRTDYNEHRPHSALADRTPSEFAKAAGYRPFALLISDKADPKPRQGFAHAGQKPPALDPASDQPSEPKMRAKGSPERPRLLARVN